MSLAEAVDCVIVPERHIRSILVGDSCSAPSEEQYFVLTKATGVYPWTPCYFDEHLVVAGRGASIQSWIEATEAVVFNAPDGRRLITRGILQLDYTTIGTPDDAPKKLTQTPPLSQTLYEPGEELNPVNVDPTVAANDGPPGSCLCVDCIMKAQATTVARQSEASTRLPNTPVSLPTTPNAQNNAILPVVQEQITDDDTVDKDSLKSFTQRRRVFEPSEWIMMPDGTQMRSFINNVDELRAAIPTIVGTTPPSTDSRWLRRIRRALVPSCIRGRSNTAATNLKWEEFTITHGALVCIKSIGTIDYVPFDHPLATSLYREQRCYEILHTRLQELKDRQEELKPIMGESSTYNPVPAFYGFYPSPLDPRGAMLILELLTGPDLHVVLHWDCETTLRRKRANFSRDSLFSIGKHTLLRRIWWSVLILRQVYLLHEAGVRHNDLKPSNFVFHCNSSKGLLDCVIRIVDLGRATPINSSTFNGGTPAYMSPELTKLAWLQARGCPLMPEDTPIDSRSDLWSLGITLAEVLAGFPCTLPLGDKSETAIQRVGPDGEWEVHPEDWLNCVRSCFQSNNHKRSRSSSSSSCFRTNKKAAIINEAAPLRNGKHCRQTLGCAIAIEVLNLFNQVEPQNRASIGTAIELLTKYAHRLLPKLANESLDHIFRQAL